MNTIEKHKVRLSLRSLLLAAMMLAPVPWTAVANAQPAQEGGIPWQDWTIAPFEQAAKQNKLILVNVGMEGCAACARMEEITYADPIVAGLISEHFIPIAVDSEARPDIGERYSDWAWPATIFLAPDATQVLAIRGNRMPRNFIPILKDLVSRHATGSLEPDPRSPYAAPPQPQETELTLTRDGLRAQIDRSLNTKYGGWSPSGIGGEQSGSRLRHLYLRAHLYDDSELLSLALKGSQGYLDNIDPVWGGVYSRSFPPGMEKVPAKFSALRAIPEKRISAQSNAIVGFSIGYQLSGDERYVQAMRQMHQFMTGWFMAPDGTFYTNQRAEPPDLPAAMSAGDYWALDSDAARRKFGIPAVDHAVYTDKNGEAIAAYVMAWEAFGNEEYLQTAVRAARAILDTRSSEAGWIVQTVGNSDVSGDQRLRPLDEKPRPFLNAQAWFGQGLLSLYRATGEAQWLEYAIIIGRATLEALEDHEMGGFYATSPGQTANIIAPRKSLEANGTAANFFYDLWVYSKNDSLAAVPERTLRAVSQPEIIRREGKITGELALALEKTTAAYVEFSVVGNQDLPASQALYEAGLKTYHPRKLLHYETPGRYPAREKPAMYICNPDMCSLPIEDPALEAERALEFRGPAGG
jgi:uncharacterized protein YyaL (SSP411 family)